MGAINPRRSRSARRRSSPQTFKQQGDKNSTAQQAADIAKLLSQSQATLHDQAVSLSGRLEARELTNEVQAISDFQKDMIAASAGHGAGRAAIAAGEVEGRHPQRAEGAAIPAARRSHLPADSGRVWQRGGGGGGGGGGAARDLAALFDLELDTEKNQYETQQIRMPRPPNKRRRRSTTR